MFEQSVISAAPKGKRLLASCIGIGGQAVLVTAMVMAPMLWPSVLPPATFTMLVPTAPPGTPVRTKPATRAQTRTPARTVRSLPAGVFQPRYIPAEVMKIVEEPVPYTAAIGVGVPGSTGAPGGGGSRLLESIMAGGSLEGGGPSEVKTQHADPVKVEPKPIIRVRVGGRVLPPVLIRRVEPRYPPLAVAAHLSGTVTLNGVIGIDGRIRELTVQAGNPLLVPAAVEAVRQWLYQPTRLNDDPVEVATSIVVTFTLNR